LDPTGNPDEEGLWENDLDRFEPGTLKEGKADLLIRTYPRAVAGTPKSFSFDPASGDFSLTFEADPSIAAPTEIFVPVARHYPDGYATTVTGPATITSGEDATVVTIAASAGGEVTVTIVRR
ncbi:MAG: hypothetical protein ACREQY_15240, partial [Candidatus Binatia bacterium]